MSITQAIFAAGVFNGLSGKDSKQVKPEDLVPFGDLMKKDAVKYVFSNKTRDLVFRLLKERRIPPAVAAFLTAIPEIQQRYINE